MHGKADDSLKPKFDPRSKGGWIDQWTRKQVIEAPNSKGYPIRLEITRIEPVYADYADLYIETRCGRAFYLLFSESHVLRSLDRPLLIWKEASDFRRAVWVV